MVHLRKNSLAQSWGSSKFSIIKISVISYFDHFLDLGFGTNIDGAKGESVNAKICSWVKLDRVKYLSYS